MSTLVAMSDGIDRRLTAHLLSHVDGEVVTAGSVAEAVRRLGERLWELLVLETVLPDGTGFDLLRQARGAGFAGAVVMIGTHRRARIAIRALENGADDYIVLPYDPGEFVARVKAVLRRTRAGALSETALLRVGPVEFDTSAMTVSLPGPRRVTVTPNEARVLHILMHHAPRIVQYKDVAAQIYDDDEAAEIAANTVAVYVCRLRHKLEEDPRHPRYIVNERGKGYRFLAGNGQETARTG